MRATGALRASLPLAFALLAGAGTGCKSSRRIGAEDFPAAIGPPFGLVRLHGGVGKVDTYHFLQQLGEVVDDGPITSVQRFDAKVTVRFDGVQSGDIEVSFDDCARVRDLLTARWGAGIALGNTRVWSSESSGWVASIEGEHRCLLTFTSIDYFSPEVGAPGAIAGIRTGMTKAEATAIAPGIADSNWAEPRLPGVANALLGVVYDSWSKRVNGSFVVFPPAAALALERRWGPAAYHRQAPHRTVWLNRASRVRALTHDSPEDLVVHIDFETYVPWRRWLGDGAAIAGLPSPILGATLDEVRRDYGDAYWDDSKDPDFDKAHPTYELTQPPTEFSPPNCARVNLRIDGQGRVQKFDFELWYESRATHDAMLSALEDKWGPRRQAGAAWLWEMQHGDLIIHLDDMSSEAIHVTVERRQP